MKRSLLELQFEQQLVDACIGDFEAEFKFHPEKRYRFDFAFPQDKFAIEVEGGTWNGGRHVTGKGYTKDCIKYAEALKLGWTVLRVTSDMINSPDLMAIGYVQSILLNLRSRFGPTLN